MIDDWARQRVSIENQSSMAPLGLCARTKTHGTLAPNRLDYFLVADDPRTAVRTTLCRYLAVIFRLEKYPSVPGPTHNATPPACGSILRSLTIRQGCSAPCT